MKYTVLVNFVLAESYDGQPGEDPIGKYILFPEFCRGVITAGVFLKDSDDNMIQIKQDDYVVIDGERYLKLYY